MFSNYFKIAIRNILRQRSYSFINIIGLSIGMACCILILLFVRYELSYDRFNENADHVYRVTREWFNSDGVSNFHLARVAPPVGPLLKNDFPHMVLEEARVLQDYQTYLRIQDNPVIEDRFFWAEPSILKILTIPFIEGNPETALMQPSSIVLTQSAARKYFGTADPMGKTINYRHLRDLKVTGIVQNVPENSHFKYDFLASFVTLYDSTIMGRGEIEGDWGGNNFLTYILLPEGFPIQQLQEQIPAFIDRHLEEAYRQMGRALPSKPLHFYNALHFQKLTDIHLHSHLTTELEQNGDINTVYIFSAIAFFILAIACINFMNLSTARSSKRAREIGIRKVLGAYRRQLIRQFIGESMVTVGFAAMLALIIVEFGLGWFRAFTQRDLSFNVLSDPVLLLGIILLAGTVGLLSGGFPAFMLSSFQPVEVLKGDLFASRKSLLRTILVVFQFAISVTLIIAVGIVFQQMHYVQEKNLGYNKNELVVLPSSSKIRMNLDEFKSQLLQNSNIVSVSGSRLVPSDMLLNSAPASVMEDNKSVQMNFRLAMQEVDYDFFKTYQIPFESGRDFSRDYGTDDSAAFILNESAVRQLGWGTHQAVGQQMIYGQRHGRVIGVVRDFNFESLHHQIVPIIFFINNGGIEQVTVRLSGRDIPGALEFLKQKWAEYRPDYPFDYTFLDDQLNSLYSKDEKLGDVFGVFAVLAIVIACLGLFGLISYSAEVRTKEIGIRKVLGSSVSGIVVLISREFLTLILIANAIAWPLAYFTMNGWLQGFAYRIHIGIWLFLASCILTLIIAFLTLSYQAVKAALGNPVEALRYE